VSKVNDIKNRKRQQKVITPSQVLAETVGEETEENNVDSKQETNETRKEEKKVERKRVSFDLRTDLHKELKMQALLQDKNIYILIEEALEKYLKENK
jgi:predicted HicB family RNase H-like nuclease